MLAIPSEVSTPPKRTLDLVTPQASGARLDEGLWRIWHCPQTAFERPCSSRPDVLRFVRGLVPSRAQWPKPGARPQLVGTLIRVLSGPAIPG